MSTTTRISVWMDTYHDFITLLLCYLSLSLPGVYSQLDLPDFSCDVLFDLDRCSELCLV